MNRVFFPLLVASLFTSTTMAQQIDFNIANRKATEVTAVNFTPVALQQGRKQLIIDKDISILIESPCQGQTLKTNWYKQGIQTGEMLTSDGVAVYQQATTKDKNGKTAIELTNPIQGHCTIRLTINGLKTGRHTLLAYHNILDGLAGKVPDVLVSTGNTSIRCKQTVRATQATQAGQSYIEFDVKEKQPVVITYQTLDDKGQPGSFATTSLTINGLVFDRPNPKKIASNPSPQDDDLHVATTEGCYTLTWQAGQGAKRHHLLMGGSSHDLRPVATVIDTLYKASHLSSAQDYYWRIDEEDDQGNITIGEVWNFRPRRLAFPGAEGYGRYAIGGRGGVVYHVTSLDDDAQHPQPGTLRFGITQVKGPRTIVFDVAGIINLKDRLVCSSPFVTVAGQTAPGKGILLREHPFGFGSDGIFRFLRLRLGKYLDKNGKTITLDGMGAAGCNNTIIDHCSVGWTIDEAFSSRNGKNISFQHNLISEALNQAGHQNYVNAKHGYAATIGGNVGSFHHNLLAHNEGRNWSMGGGLDGAGYYAGRLDLFNNVVYNWGNRACDGGAHEVNFVGNYYKMGPATTMKYILNAQLEGTGKGSQAYYIHDNIRQASTGETVSDKEGDTYKYTTSHGQVVDWKVFADKPFFPSYAKIESAQAAYKNVLSDVGANQPMMDEHDRRMVDETLKGTYKYTGSKTGKKGLIDDNQDANNDAWKEFEGVAERRPADWDTDQDGMPDWWEHIVGTNPQAADNNQLIEGEYTQLERYLNWMAEPHFLTKAGDKLTIDLKPYFAGYDQQPKFTFCIDGTLSLSSISLPQGKLKLNKKGILTISINKNATAGLLDCPVKATDNDHVAELLRTFHIAILK